MPDQLFMQLHTCGLYTHTHLSLLLLHTVAALITFNQYKILLHGSSNFQYHIHFIKKDLTQF